MEIHYFLFILLSFTASLISAVFGFGTALIVLALGSHILPVKEAIALATVLFTVSTALKTALYGKSINWKVAVTMAVSSLPFAYLGATLMTDLPTEILRRILASMILLYLVLSIFNLFPKIKLGTAGIVAGSATYGFVSGLVGSGNLIKAIIFREMNMTKETFVGAMAATSLLSNTAKLTAYMQSGLLNARPLWPIVGLVLAAIAAVVLGQRVLRVVNVAHFEMGIQMVLLLSAIALLI